jgi:hypothetical protein
VLKRKVGEDLYQLSPNENKYALPLTTDIITLARLEQNPQ